MRVLVVDQDSTSNLAIARSLRERYTVDAVSSKGDCMDLLRANVFEVIVAGERLEDGSGLELLGQVSKRWPAMLRIFAADRHRLKLLKGRLGPFELFQTLAYPIDPERLIATLTLAESAREAQADTANIQHVVLSTELEAEQQDPFPAPQPEPRVVPETSPPADQKPVRNHVHRSRQGSSSGMGPRVGAPGKPRLAEHSRAASRGRNRPPPVRFPSLERPVGASATPSFLGGGSLRRTETRSDSIAAAVALVRQVVPTGIGREAEAESRRAALMIGGAVVAAVVVILVGSKLFGPKEEPSAQTAPPTLGTPQYPHEVTDLVGEIETALRRGDLALARVDIAKLQQMAPSHPRLPVLQDLIAQRPGEEKPKVAEASAHSTHSADATRSSTASRSDSTRGSIVKTGATSTPFSAHVTSKGPVQSPKHESTASHDGVLAGATGLPPETPTGMMLAHKESTIASTAPATPAVMVASGGAGGSAVPGSAAAPESASPAVATVTPLATATTAVPVSTAARRANSDEPPPVIREARLIRRVNANYPFAARRDAIVGSVDLDITVSQQGLVKNVAVVHAEPSDIFNKSAVAAVRNWKYDPQYVDGLPAEAHLKVHLDFRPD